MENTGKHPFGTGRFRRRFAYAAMYENHPAQNKEKEIHGDFACFYRLASYPDYLAVIQILNIFIFPLTKG